MLEAESYMLSHLKGGLLSILYIVGIPIVKSYGCSADSNVLVMELLGPSLDQLLKKYNIFSLKTVCKLAIQIVNI